MLTLSVIIPTHNRPNSTARAIRSVQLQTWPANEIIVVDDGSTDGTASSVRAQFPDVTVLQQVNKGVSSARNTGIGYTSSSWVAFLDSDDEWLPDKLQLQISAMMSRAQPRLVHSDEIWIRNGVRVNSMNKHQKYGGWIYPHCLPRCAISPSSAILRRDVFDDIGLFDESLPACEDYDFWLRLCAIEPVTFIDKPLLRKYGGHSDQLSRAHWGMDRFRLQALAKAIRTGNLKPAYLALTKAQLATKLSIFCHGARKRCKYAEAEELEMHYQDLLR